MRTGGEHVGACLQRHLEAGERCAGAGLAAVQVLAAKERGVEMRTSTAVIELVIEDGQVLGVVARDGAGTKRIRARLGGVLATGGYDWQSKNTPAVDALDWKSVV